METKTTCRDLTLLRELLASLDNEICRLEAIGPSIEGLQEASDSLHRWADVQEEEYGDHREWGETVNINGSPVVLAYAMHLAIKDHAKALDEYTRMRSALREEPPFDWEQSRDELEMLPPGESEIRD